MQEMNWSEDAATYGSRSWPRRTGCLGVLGAESPRNRLGSLQRRKAHSDLRFAPGLPSDAIGQTRNAWALPINYTVGVRNVEKRMRKRLILDRTEFRFDWCPAVRRRGINWVCPKRRRWGGPGIDRRQPTSVGRTNGTSLRRKRENGRDRCLPALPSSTDSGLNCLKLVPFVERTGAEKGWRRIHLGKS